MPKVSIIIATYNGEKYLPDAIESVLYQTLTDWELIIVNDASIDRTQDIINGYLTRDSRIICIRNEFNLERSASRNRGMRIARGEYIAFLDDDDTWTPEKMEMQLSFLLENPEYILCGTGANIINAQSHKISEQQNILENDVIRSKILTYNPFILSSICIKKEITSDIYFNEDINMAEDYEFILRIASRGKIQNLAECLVNYRIYGNSSLKHPYRIRWNSIIAVSRYGSGFPNYYRSILLLLCLFFVPYRIVSFLGKALPKRLKDIILP